MILLISANFPPEPVAAALLSYDLAIALSGKHKVTVITPKPSRPCGFSFPHQSIDDAVFEHIVLNSYTCPESKIFGRMRESHSFGKHAVRFIKKKYKEISCIYISVWPLLAQYLIVKASERYSIPAIVHVQDIYPESLSNRIPIFGHYIRSLLLPLDRYILNHASQIIANSDHMRSVFEKTRGIPAHKINIVKNWQDENKFVIPHELPKMESVNNQEEKPFTFMYLGNIGPVAGVDFLIRTFIEAALPDALLVIAGSGSQKEKCMQLAKSHKRSNIQFSDVPSGKVMEIQHSADVMLLPVIIGASLSSVPSKLPAYMFSKKPVIACVENDSDTALAIKQSGCGLVVLPEDTQSLILAMRDMISKPKQDLFEFGQNGFDYAMENFSKEKNLKSLTSIILKTLDE